MKCNHALCRDKQRRDAIGERITRGNASTEDMVAYLAAVLCIAVKGTRRQLNRLDSILGEVERKRKLLARLLEMDI